jgi:hypothetical protein
MLSLSNSWLDWFVPIVAASGAAVIAVGLWLENAEEKCWFRDITELRSAKSKAGRGRKMVFRGVLLEFILGIGFGVYELWGSNPWNGKILQLSADVYFEVKGTNGPLPGIAQLKWGNEGMMSPCDSFPVVLPNGLLSGATLFPLYAFNLNSGNPLVNEPAISSNRSYSLEFQSEGTKALLTELGIEYPMKNLATAKFLRIGLHRLPQNTEILSGAVELVATGTRGNVRESFRIAPQIAPSDGIWTIIIATNAATAK